MARHMRVHSNLALTPSRYQVVVIIVFTIDVIRCPRVLVLIVVLRTCEATYAFGHMERTTSCKASRGANEKRGHPKHMLARPDADRLLEVLINEVEMDSKVGASNVSGGLNGAELPSACMSVRPADASMAREACPPKRMELGERMRR
eukprot:CAMPEP_0115875634 /NCGR_PEP_ID=MMETSP0287-20121206/25200_1 /TAXON_ID=412157 /ORGANISM="Chrysochromulina rotalis, Strain UIO044" /LENGTH=146 /DNA_ID=CAMNT_0003330907 /DNA_START=112 /DNA_END=553 /DNA_ORIENTATION=-